MVGNRSSVIGCIFRRCVWMVNMLILWFHQHYIQTVRMKPLANLVKYINNVPMEVSDAPAVIQSSSDAQTKKVPEPFLFSTLGHGP